MTLLSPFRRWGNRRLDKLSKEWSQDLNSGTWFVDAKSFTSCLCTKASVRTIPMIARHPLFPFRLPTPLWCEGRPQLPSPRIPVTRPGQLLHPLSFPRSLATQGVFCWQADPALIRNTRNILLAGGSSQLSLLPFASCGL